ncbi:MAG: ATP-dependent Clp protease ATP-binding subunit ClpX [Planctomycetes bacterium]|nr:ATP-dependent Clp protease ATP-binding subunit ClpX [Planctomycetota bacterium]
MSNEDEIDNEELDCCSFCTRDADQVDRLISGPPGIYICNECVEVCATLLENSDRKTIEDAPDLEQDLSPREIKEHLDSYIIGQERAKRTIAVAVYNHYKRLRLRKANHEVELEKSNILMLGPTGCGKTLIARSLAKLLDVPFAIGDATTITEAGYVGEDVENLLLRLIQSADNDIPRAEMGILYIDEVDKIAGSSGNVSITRDVSGEGVQQSLLKLIEGTTANVPPGGGRKHPEQKYLQINTENILFICGGAFSGIDEIIKRRLGSNTVGFTVGDNGEDQVHSEKIDDESWIFAQVCPEDLVNFGLIPEFVGRLPVVSSLESLNEDALISILTEPKNALVKQYQTLFDIDGADLTFTQDALKAIAQKAVERKTGARALRSIIEEIMLDMMFDLPDQNEHRRRHYVITESVVNDGQAPEISIVDDSKESA